MIGGQAVNYWAERYLSTEPELQKLLPFTSRDIDFKGNQDDVRRIAEQLKLSPSFPRKVEMKQQLLLVGAELRSDLK